MEKPAKKILCLIALLGLTSAPLIGISAQPTMLYGFNKENGSPNVAFQELINAGLAQRVPATGSIEKQNSPESNPELFCYLQGNGYRLPLLSDYVASLKGIPISEYETLNGRVVEERKIGGLTSEWGESLNLYSNSDFVQNASNFQDTQLITGSLIATEQDQVMRHLKNASSGVSGGFALISTGFFDFIKKPVACMRDIKS